VGSKGESQKDVSNCLLSNDISLGTGPDTAKKNNKKAKTKGINIGMDVLGGQREDDPNGNGGGPKEVPKEGGHGGKKNCVRMGRDTGGQDGRTIVPGQSRGANPTNKKRKGIENCEPKRTTESKKKKVAEKY